MTPVARGTLVKAKPTTATRFDVAHTIDGWEVIDSDGRSVSGSMPLWQANEARATLNDAALVGGKALARALGCLEDEELAMLEEMGMS